HLDHIGAAWHFNESRTIIAAHRLAANKIMLRDDFSMLRKMFNEPNVPINVDIWLEEGNLLDLGDFRLNVMYTPGHTSACISLFDQEKGLLFAADTLMPGGVMGGVFGSGSISDYIQSLERLKGLDSKILLSGHGRLSDTPQEDVRIAIQRSHALLSDTAQLFDALDARSNFEPIMQSVRDLNKLDDS
ncbi:MAG: MBL fold metallo-hydrolase, partial [Bradyrhizobium sp.]